MQFYVALYLNVQERSGFNFIGGKNYTIYVSPERRSGSGVTSHDDQEMHTTTRKEIQRQGIMLEHDYIISIYITYIYISYICLN